MVFNIDKILVYESVEYTPSTKEGEEGVAVEIKYDGHRIFFIDGLSPELMRRVRMDIIDLLRFIKGQLSEEV